MTRSPTPIKSGRLLAAIALGACAGGAGPSIGAPPSVESWTVGTYQPGTHSHNDYERDRPLADALEHGFASIEVDVALRDGVLYVTHDSTDIDRSATFVGKYMEPLRALVRTRGGTVYGASDPPLQLLVDVKSSPEEAYRALDALFVSYDDVVSSWTDGAFRRRAATVVVSGNRATAEIRSQSRRHAAIDGRIWEGRVDYTPAVMPLVSINWDDTEGRGDRMDIAKRFIEEVHREGREVRFWNTPDSPDTWAWLRALGVDYIGTDDPRRLSRFMRHGR